MEILKVDSDWIRAHLPADMSDILPQDMGLFPNRAWLADFVCVQFLVR